MVLKENVQNLPSIRKIEDYVYGKRGGMGIWLNSNTVWDVGLREIKPSYSYMEKKSLKHLQIYVYKQKQK